MSSREADIVILYGALVFVSVYNSQDWINWDPDPTPCHSSLDVQCGDAYH